MDGLVSANDCFCDVRLMRRESALMIPTWRTFQFIEHFKTQVDY